MVGVVAAVVLLAGCRVDVVVDLTMKDDGTGQVAVTATADADVVEQAPGLAEDLRFDDAIAAGWTVEGPSPAADGGLTATLRHSFTSAEEAAALLRSVGAPFADVGLSRTTADDATETRVTGSLTLPSGFDSFADAELLQAVGGTPFADDLAAAGATPASSMSVVLRATLPGDVEDTTAEQADRALRWTAPLDGSALDIATRTVQQPRSTWASVLAVVALAGLVVWTLLAVAVIIAVVRIRGRRRG